MKDAKEKWMDLSIKEKFAIGTALVAFFAGWILTGIAAFVPLFLTEHSVLIVLAQGMTYAAAVFGVAQYFNAEAIRMRRDLHHMMQNPEEFEREERAEEQ